MNTKRALAFIFCTVTLDVLALGLMIPVLPTLVLGFMRGDMAGAAEIFGLFATVWGLIQFFCSPLLGALSDRFGRRPVILLSCLGLGLDYILMALAPNLAWLFVGRVISGIIAATIMTAFAYIADVTPADNRAKAFGVVGIGFGVGFILGPAIGGLLGGLDPRLPFWFSAAACLINAGFGWFVLLESLPPERRMAFEWKRANPLSSLRLVRGDAKLLGLAGAGFLGQLAHQVLPSMFVLYGAYRYAWGEEIVGLTLAGVGSCSALVQGLLVGPAVAKLGERCTMLMGLWGGAIGMAIYGLAPTGIAVLDRRTGDVAMGAGRARLASDDEPASEAIGIGPAAGRQYGDHEHRRTDRPGPVRAEFFAFHRGPRAYRTARRAVPAGCGTAVPCHPAHLGRYRTWTIRHPASVSLQTNQSGFSGLLNHGSAQPWPMHWRTMAGSTSWPSRSNSGSLPPGWASPRRKYSVSEIAGRTPVKALSFNA